MPLESIQDVEGGVNLTEMLLTQCRSSVGVLNPSPLNTWPRCPPQAAQVISVLLPSGSGERFMAPGRPSKKAGQPHPELNLVVDLYNGVPHPAHSYVPSSKNLSYSPVPRGSVPFWRRIRNCSGERTALHSSSDFWTEPTEGEEAAMAERSSSSVVVFVY